MQLQRRLRLGTVGKTCGPAPNVPIRQALGCSLCNVQALVTMRSVPALAGRAGALARYSTAAAGETEDIVDVAIVGAGMVGAAVAALLRESSVVVSSSLAVFAARTNQTNSFMYRAQPADQRAEDRGARPAGVRIALRCARPRVRRRILHRTARRRTRPGQRGWCFTLEASTRVCAQQTRVPPCLRSRSKAKGRVLPPPPPPPPNPPISRGSAPPPPRSLGQPHYPPRRVSTITPASIDTLARAGAWHEVAPPASAEFGDMQASVWAPMRAAALAVVKELALHAHSQRTYRTAAVG